MRQNELKTKYQPNTLFGIERNPKVAVAVHPFP